MTTFSFGTKDTLKSVRILFLLKLWQKADPTLTFFLYDLYSRTYTHFLASIKKKNDNLMWKWNEWRNKKNHALFVIFILKEDRHQKIFLRKKMCVLFIAFITIRIVKIFSILCSWILMIRFDQNNLIWLCLKIYCSWISND